MPESGKSKLLMVEDRLSIARCYTEFLSGEDCDITHVFNGAQAIEHLQNELYAIILLDLQLPDIDGYRVLEYIRQKKIGSEVIVITAHGSYEVSKRVIGMGANDYLEKPFSADRLRITVRNAIDRQLLAKKVNRYQNGFCNFVGSSVAMQNVYRIIENAATSTAAVFITGESGTGKELCADALHMNSARRNRQCVTLNCAAIPRDLMESEIFGHVKGAFTGATCDRTGAASLADGGTLFLDEIGEMDLTLQSKFLRFIQTGQFKKVGGSRVESVDVRFVSATNRDPMEQIAAGTFRSDLYYRLNVIPIHMPPLRERGNDIMEISQRYLARYVQQEGKRFNGLSDKAKKLLLDYPWPGNVRELLNVLRNAVVLNDGEIITESMLPINATWADHKPKNSDAKATAAAPQPNTSPRPVESVHRVDTWTKERNTGLKTNRATEIRPLWQVELEAIEKAIALCDGNISQAAKLLEVSPSTIYRKKLSLKRQGGPG